MKRVFIGLGIATMASAGVLSICAFKHEATLAPNAVVAGVKVGGLKPDEARFKLRAWWETERVKPLELHSKYLKGSVEPMTPGRLGVVLDDEASIAQIPTQDFWQDITSSDGEEQLYAPVYKTVPTDYAGLKKAVEAAVPEARPARVVLVKGAFVRTLEVTGMELDSTAIADAVQKALLDGAREIELPIKEAPKRVSDEQLRQISEVVQTFSTHFPRNPNRNNNIRLAAAKLNGVVLAPGESLSFNQTVGRRTIEGGFKEAGVYVNGRHDTGVGGGICQVSTTLYNASLLSDLKIVRRQNHSMPVAYVPLGRDATVDYGTRDLVIENNYETPIAISSLYEPNRLTFRILGKKKPGLMVKIERSGQQSWPVKVSTVRDGSLPPGARKVVEKGSAGRSINTTRVVYMNGVEVRREPLGRSFYPGGKRIVAVGPDVPKPPTQTAVVKPGTVVIGQ